MSYTISKRFGFSASHQLKGLPEDHPCSRLHGHNYEIEVELASDRLDEVGMVWDYRNLSTFKRILDVDLDHKHLNDVVAYNPTAENLARDLFGRAFLLSRLVTAVRGLRDAKDVCRVPRMSELVVSEIFGPTFQGEGPSAGRRAGFIRLGRCNLSCGKGEGATWACDTPYTWNWDVYDPVEELKRIPIKHIAAQIKEMDVPLTVITGGEPMIQQARLVELLDLLKTDVEIETNGTRAPSPELTEKVTQFNVSPKLANSGMAEHLRIKAGALETLNATQKAIFKFVVTTRDDLAEIAEVVGVHGIQPDRVWVMPGGTESQVLQDTAAEVADAVLERGWNLTQRLHVLLWEDVRGR